MEQVETQGMSSGSHGVICLRMDNQNDDMDVVNSSVFGDLA